MAHRPRRPSLASASTRARDERGQSLVEFALVVPLLLLLTIAIGDFGRVFTAAVAAESAAREAADYGAFLGSARWDETDASVIAINESEMRRRACAAMSKVAGYSNGSGDCTDNPNMGWDIIKPTGVTACEGRTGLVEPCRIHVTVSFTFRPWFAFPPIPSAIILQRESTFAISDLTGS